MILAVKKDGTVYEVVGCDAFYPTSWLEDLNGNRFLVKDSELKFVFDKDEKFNEYLEQRV